MLQSPLEGLELTRPVEEAEEAEEEEEEAEEAALVLALAPALEPRVEHRAEPRAEPKAESSLAPSSFLQAQRPTLRPRSREMLTLLLLSPASHPD